MQFGLRRGGGRLSLPGGGVGRVGRAGVAWRCARASLLPGGSSTRRRRAAAAQSHPGLRENRDAIAFSTFFSSSAVLGIRGRTARGVTERRGPGRRRQHVTCLHTIYYFLKGLFAPLLCPMGAVITHPSPPAPQSPRQTSASLLVWRASTAETQRRQEWHKRGLRRRRPTHPASRPTHPLRQLDKVLLLWRDLLHRERGALAVNNLLPELEYGTEVGQRRRECLRV